ncbi:polyprenyl synthetase family protein [Tolypothrix campylonemoides VB511288]|nr:polyprenyl synthetase family protein [Tolypothrix campylonemoides VB511288]
MNTEVLKQSSENSTYNQKHVSGHTTIVSETYLQPSHLVEYDTDSKKVTFDLSAYLSKRQLEVDEALEQSITVVYPEKIYEAMRYSLLAGGKRLRPILCIASCELCGGTAEMAMPTACALEMFHTASLIHDDLPAMDNDDYRRGKLTNHKVYGEDTAILAGDGLLAYAFKFVVEKTEKVPAERLLRVIDQLSYAIGAGGLVGGQIVDLASEKLQIIDLETLNFIHCHKTGVLLQASVVSGAILAGANDEILQPLSHYARNIGLAFQIIDDILDITATTEELGKTAGKDLQAQKATYPSLLGIEESKHQAQKLIAEAKAELAPFGERAIPLMAIADFITARTH